MLILLAFLIGVVSGLRALTGLAVLSWAARLHRVHLEDTMLAFLGYAATPFILTVMAVGELINDKLPKTPSRTVPPAFITRVIMGGFCGAVVGAILGASGNMWIVGCVVGAVGSVVGTFGGARVRALLAQTFGRDLPAALLEDVVAIVLAVLVATSVGG
jgi:uncharacterized membrane protein